jgi:hypothetical protein
MVNYKLPDSFYTIDNSSLEEFIFGMLQLGKPLDISIVGVFDEGPGRGSRRDVDLPLHQDGIYSQALADSQGGEYIEQPGIDIVGLYCLREGDTECLTLIDNTEINLKKGQALIFDNQKVSHGRKGQVGNRILIRIWIQKSVVTLA